MEDYQKKALETKLYSEIHVSPLLGRLFYLLSGLNGETGELAEKIKKIARDQRCIISEKDRQLLLKEAGDSLWYLTAIIDELGSTLDEVQRINLEKLKSRLERGKLQGSGDER